MDSTKHSTTLDIVIVNWNSGDLLNECVESVHQSELVSCILKKVIIVDNASTDNSLIQVKKVGFEKLEIIENKINKGFGKACNQGAKAGNSDLVLFLNPDTRLFSDTLEKSACFYGKNRENMGALGVKIINDKGEIEKTCRFFPTKLRRVSMLLGLQYLFPKSSIKMLFWNHKNTRYVDQVIGAYFMVSRCLYEKLQGFDERFFVYYEEVDFCLRANQIGYKNLYFSDTSLYHKGGGVTEKVKATRLFYSMRSWVQYEKKHRGWFSMGGAIIILLFEFIVRFSFLIIRRRGNEIKDLQKGYGMFFSFLITRDNV